MSAGRGPLWGRGARRAPALLAAIALVFFAPEARAAVSEFNGNFYVGYTDMFFGDGTPLKLERVYNSKSPYVGMFGLGWGSDFETFLSTQADGSVVIHENGGGANVAFDPPELSERDLQRAIERIAAAQEVPNRERLRTDQRYRHDEWERLSNAGRLEPSEVPIGTRLRSTKFEFQYVVRTPDGYLRFRDEGSVQTFDDRGRLSSVRSNKGVRVAIERDADGRLARLEDSLGNAIKLELNADGRLVAAESNRGKRATYRYSGGALAFTRDVDGNEYRFRFSGDGRSNLLGIGYVATVPMTVTMNPVSQNETVSSVDYEDGSGKRMRTEYRYEGLFSMTPKIRVEEWVGGVHKVRSDAWELSVDPSGRQWRSKLVRDEDGKRRVAYFSPVGEYPTRVEESGTVQTFAYDDRARLTRWTGPAGEVDLEYGALGSPLRAVRTSRPGGAKIDVRYTLDERGNLLGAKSADGRSAEFKLDREGRLSELRVQKRRLTIGYTPLGNLATLQLDGARLLTVTWAEAGNDPREVVRAPKRELDRELTTLLDGALALLRPARVELDNNCGCKKVRTFDGLVEPLIERLKKLGVKVSVPEAEGAP